MRLSGTATIRSLRLRGTPGRAGACARTGSLLLGAVFLLALGQPLAAQTRDDLRVAMQRLRKVEASLEPLPSSTITRDVGQIAVIEHDGSSYDARRPDDALNYEARIRVGLTFYETHADAYDFLVVFTNFPFKTDDATAFHLFGRNDVEGIGKFVGSVPVVFGSPSRLKGWIDMADVSQYRERPFSLSPGDLGFRETLNVLAHEVGHQWLAQATYKEGYVTRDDLLGKDDVHWSYLLDTDASLYYGADWRDDGNGSFTAARVREQYSALDLYLMGFLPAEKVPPLLLLENPAIDRRGIAREGDVVATTGRKQIEIGRLVDAMGPRLPDSVHSQKEFRLGFVFLTKPGTEPSEEDLAAVEQVRRAFGAHFFALTHGVAWADTTLVETPAPPRAAVPDLPKALGWLVAQQAIDGSWADSAETRLRDTAASVRALATAGVAGTAWQRGIAWLQGAAPESLDFRARVASALGPAGVAAADRTARIATLLSTQNADGGFGAGRDFASDALDTALALRALRALEYPEDARVRAAVPAFADLANPDGGWPAVAGGESSTVATAEVLLALLDWSDTPGSAALRGTGLAALLARRNVDGGFGSSPSTPHASALALEVLLRSGAPADVVSPLTSWLEQNQLADGSWSGSPYQTALVLAALRQSLGPNLVVPPATLALAPNPAPEGEVVRVSARVRNDGRGAAPASVARLYDGDAASAPSLGEAPVPALAPGEDAEVSFDYPTQDRVGARTLSVVADAAGQVPESREDDNTASLALTVVGKLADLVVGPGDIVVSPAGPEVGEPTILTVTVRNAGERSAAASALLVSVTGPSGATVHLPLASLPAVGPGEAASASIPWSPVLAGTHLVRATADVGYAIPESDEANNTAERPVRVFEAAPDAPELTLVHASVTPASLEELPQSMEVMAFVENSGRANVSTTVAVVDDRTWAGLGAAPVDLGPRSSKLVTIPGSVWTPGSRRLLVTVDPYGRVSEQDEADNTVAVGFPDGRTLDLEVHTASLSATDVQIGELVTVTAEVRNRGTIDVASIPVQLARVTADGPVEVARTALGLPAGTSRTVDLSWRASVVGAAVPLLVRVDPFDLLAERREDNNAVALALSVRPSGLPNLRLSGADVTMDPDPLVEGGGATLTAVVRNTGVVPAGPFAVSFVVGDPDRGGRTVGEVTVDGMAAGESRSVSFAWPRVDVGGSLGLYVIADAGAQVEESDESDNRAFRPFSSIGLPDLVLTAADVTLDPAYPRAGEPVTVHATVRNLGGRPTGTATSLSVAEGEAGARVGIGSLAVPPLEPGAFVALSLPWTPAAPPGPRPLSLVLDPDGLVAEQDEGNNEVLRTVVVQDADLFLTEPVFSPDGDGVKEQTAVAWRATGPVTVVVSNSRGEAVRTLVDGGPPSGSATWDGRSSRGLVVWDGSYTLSVIGDAGRTLGRASVVVDTNRSPIHDATPGRTTVRNLTCALTPYLRGPAWMPGEDEVLYVVYDDRAGFQVGLLRVGVNGGYSYVAQDVWYRSASFLSPSPVSPDGREVLVRAGAEAFVVDLISGERRSLGSVGYDSISWSPDGRFLLVGWKVLARDGSLVTELPWGGEPVWAPDSERIARLDYSSGDDASAGSVLVMARDGTSLGSIPLPWGDLDRAGWVNPYEITWRGDGKIVATLSHCVPTGGEADDCRLVSFRVDPDALTAKRLSFPAAGGVWSPDGSRVLMPEGTLYLENGTLLGPLLPGGAIVSPRSSAATFLKGAGDMTTPGSVCGAKGSDTFVISSAANLASQLEVARLPGNNGLVIRGTAADRNLERFQLDYASQVDPTTWHPIGAALDTPVLDDVLAAWVPPAPGTYVLRLSVSDLAGHASVRTQVVPWDRVPLLANLTQSDYYLSPDGDGVKDSVLFRYTVLSPTRVDVRVVGPDPAGPDEPPGQEVWRTAFEHTTWGPQSFSWDGKDASGQVVADGRYTVYINDLPFRVEVDDTPPEIGLRLENLAVAPADVNVTGPPSCIPAGLFQGGPGPSAPLSSVSADRAWHVVDERLKSWVLHGATSRPLDSGTEPVFVPEAGSYGQRARVRREEGRPMDRRDSEYLFPYAPLTGLELEAWDLAGNHSRVLVERPPEAVFPLGATWAAKCEVAAAVLLPEDQDDRGNPSGEPVNALRPDGIVLQAGATLRRPIDEQNLRLVFQPVDGGAERDLPLDPWDIGGHRNLRVASFEELGVDPMGTYRGRFTAQGESAEITSSPFVFCPCNQWLRAFWVAVRRPDRPRPDRFVIAQVHLDAAVVKAQADVQIERLGILTSLGTLDLLPIDAEAALERFGLRFDSRTEEAFFAQLPDLSLDCANRLHVGVRVRDAAGNNYPSSSRASEVENVCQKLGFVLPDECHAAITLRQTFKYCEGSPDVLEIGAEGFTERPARITILGGPGSRVIDTFDVVPVGDGPVFGRQYEVSVEGYSGESYHFEGQLAPLDPAGVGAEAKLDAIIDRDLPVGDILLPPDGGFVCLAPDVPAPPLQTLGRVDDASPLVAVQASRKTDEGTWVEMPLACPTTRCAAPSVTPGRPFDLSWNGAGLQSGWHDLRLDFCDRAGNHGSATHRILVTRDPPAIQIKALAHPVFSPNGDGRAEETQVTLGLLQPGNLSVRVRAASAQGAVVRTLWTDMPEPAEDILVQWDGRGDDGKMVPDGKYWIEISVSDACGGATGKSTSVEVDTTPPAVAITEPSGGQRVSASVDVLGRVTDPHVATWTLDVGCGSGEWTPLATRTYAVEPGSFLARWDTSLAPPGECHLRLVAEDRAENRSAEAVATATVERGELLESLSATPDVFSPNGDGRRETATLGYALRRAARVRLEVRDTQGQVLRAFETGATREAGAWSFVWDGTTDAGQTAPEGLHLVWARVEDPDVATVYEEKSIRLDLDRTPPAVTISRPAPDGFVPLGSTVRGSVTDRNLALFTVSLAPAGSPAVEVARSSQGSPAESDLAPLSSLAEGPHVLAVVATDTAENETRIDRLFLVDATPPRVAIQAPGNGAFLRRGETPVPVAGLVADDHLQSWTLRFGAGTAPALFMPIAQGETGGDGIALGAWAVQSIPDGVYTLSLVATDRAGLSTESRVTVTLDSVPPAVALTGPAAGGYVTKPGPILGTASDANLASWELESAPGESATAYQWSPLGSGSASVTEGPLAEWSPLPPDGIYTLRLTAHDKVELSSSARATVTVDTTPPAMPTGLEAVVTKAREGYGRVVVTWKANTEPDLAGYRIERPNEEWSELLGSPSWDDGERVEGRYTYRVLAEDKAGNQSLAATLPVLVDLTPPLVSFSFPAESAPVSGAIDVRGTAWSADDFAEYRLRVGAGDAPTEWRLLRSSSVPVPAGTLGEWLAVGDGPYVLALDAKDTNGNEARVTRRVVVDMVPPEPPVLVAVAKEPAPADWLVPSWLPSPSPDVIGTLVYRNGHLANATSIVLGDRKGYLVPGTSYKDEKLPDGEHCYYVVAMDAAGNESAPSIDTKCQSLDNHAPHAVVTNPPDGARFGYPVRVIAETPDLDVASVRFERRAGGVGDWVAFGEARTAPPWETTLDPKPLGGEELAAGPHELRAVATDRSGNTDPDPARITVVYGDTTPPSAPAGLLARVDGTDVTLTWTPVDAPDVASYRLYRDGERIAEGLTEPRHVDSGLALATYVYVVTAVDADGNESAPSTSAEAVVYAVSLEQPAWPVVSASVGSVKGDGSRAETTVRVLRDDAAIAQGAGTGGAFAIDGVPLVPDGNVLRARGEDAAGNRSVASDEVVLISNAAPGPVTNLESAVDGKTVSLQWAPVSDADLVGYVVRRDGERLTPTATQDGAATVEATSTGWAAPFAFDGDPSTAWVVPASYGVQSWTVTFPQPVLVEQVRLRFAPPEGSNPGIPATYTLLALWQDRYLPVVRVRGNTQLVVEHRLPAPFLTTGLSVELDSPGGLAEVTVERLDVVPPGTESFEDQAVPDGRHTYAVAAIDWYGAEGTPATVEVPVGDVDAPGRPTGLAATPIVRNVQLTWNASPEPDVAHYVVLRDGSRIGTSPAPSYLDPARPNGTYRYAVIAVDEAGHESEPSDPADATIAVAPAPPSAPVILEPTDAADPIELDASRIDVAGRADPGTFVSLDVDGEWRGTAPAQPGFLPATQVFLPYDHDIALSPDGKEAAWSTVAGAVSVMDLATWEVRLVPHGGAGWVEKLAFSPGGNVLAMVRRQDVSPYLHEVALLHLADGSVGVPMTGSWEPDSFAWSPDGSRLAVSLRDSGGGSLQVIETATGVTIEIARSSGVDTQLRWSPDGSRIAFTRSWGWGTAAELHVLDLDTSRTQVLDFEPWPDAPPSWSADGHRLAWTTAAEQPLRVRVQDVEQEQAPTDVTDAGSDVVDPRFSPDGDWLSFVRLTHLDDGTTLWSVHAIHQVQSVRVTVSGPQEEDGPPDTHEWLGARLAIRMADELDLYAPEAGRFVVRDVALAPGENRLVARATDPATGLESPDSETVLVTVPEEDFPDLAVVPGGILSLPPIPLAAHDAQLRVRVENRGEADASETEVLVRVLGPQGEIALETQAALAAIGAGAESSVLLDWTPAVPGTYTVHVEVDPDGRVAEASETNNTAERLVTVVAQEGLAAEIASDRASYPALSTAHVTVRVANAGTQFTGVARTTVEDPAGSEVAVLDERAVSLEWGKTVSYTVDWSAATTPAGAYAFRVRVRPTGGTEPAAFAEREFAIESGLSVLARVRPTPVTVAEGTPASFVLDVENRSTNVALDGATARLRVRPEGTTGLPTFETVRALPSLATSGPWEATDVWPAAQPAGRYAVLFEVTKDEAVLASASAVLTVVPAAAAIRGTLTVVPGDVLAGASAEAHVSLENQGTAAVSGYPLAVELVSGPEATVHVSVPATVDLGVGETRPLTLSVATSSVAPGPYVVRLRGGASPVTLDRSRLVVHGLIAPPSPHAPADGARVGTAHPALVVNDASSPEGAALTYEYALFGDESLTQALPGVAGVPETASRTSWTVAAGLAEDATYWWRARATDGFSASAWSMVASFTVDAVNKPPTAPVPDTPLPGARVASLQPTLAVRNALDPERQPLTYEFRLAADEAMTQVLASEAGVAEGLGLTSWTATTTLAEGATCYWIARAKTGGGEPEDFSPWSVPVAFLVDTVNGAPTAPTPLRPIGGAAVTTHTPALVVGNATDPEGDPLTYRFEIDMEPELGSPELQTSPELGPGAGETEWTPPVALHENTLYYWRAHASDGVMETPSVLASFFVNAVDEPPGAPVPLDPVDGRTVGTATPTLRLRNAIDPENDPLTYEFEVRDAAEAIVASVVGVPSGADETTWTVTSPLSEDQAFTWSARASDGELEGEWSKPATFRVDAVAEPPTAPVPWLPADGAVLEERRPSLVVQNATSPDGLALTYAFDLEDAAGAPVESVDGIPETPDTTSWTPSVDLADGAYQWRARASAPQQAGPWSATWRFEVLVDLPPAPPGGLTAVAGDAHVRLDWAASPEDDVTGYHVYRSTTAGGPHAFVAAVPTNGYDDLGLANGVTYYYVVTALDARSESGPSSEAAARPEAPQALVAEVRYDPAVVRGECLLPWSGGRHHLANVPADRQPWFRSAVRLAAPGEDAGGGLETSCQPSGCPDWLLATLELPAGHDPATIDVASLRLLGSVRADSGYSRIVDLDRDGLPERQVRFRFGDVAPGLSVGTNSATIVGKAGGSDVQGTGTIEVLPLAAGLRVTPRTLQRRSCGEDVQAQITFAEGVSASNVSPSSIRLNGVVPVERVVQKRGQVLVVKFDRAAVIRVLPRGSSVEVRVTGTLQGLPFVGVDHIRVTE
jgi:subtilase family serine protease